MPSRALISILLACLLTSGGCCYGAEGADRAQRWFQAEIDSFFGNDDGEPPAISCASVVPSVITWGDPRAEISAVVMDPTGIRSVYAEVGGRIIPMVSFMGSDLFKGYCGSNLPPDDYKITIVAVDRAGCASMYDNLSIKFLDPLDLNANRIEDRLEELGSADIPVIVLHNENLSREDRLAIGMCENDFGIVPGCSMVVSGDQLEDIAGLSGVEGIYLDQELKILGGRSEVIINDPRLADFDFTGCGVTIAILDTGADPKHISLTGDSYPNGSKIVAFQDFVNGNLKPYDDHGHGTHCASLIAGAGGPRGVAPGASLVVVKVMDEIGVCKISDALKAFDWCLENKNKYSIDIVSFSVGGDQNSSSILEDACNRMVDSGLVVCVAAGNSGPSFRSIVTPGGAEKVITVGAIDSLGEIYPLSSRGPTPEDKIKPDLVALGVDVASAEAGTLDESLTMSGTSMAVPQVAGASAVILEKSPDLEPLDVKRILMRSADDLGEIGPDNTFGWGALNLTEALQMLDHPVSEPSIEGLYLSNESASVGDPISVEARLSGEVESALVRIDGPGKEMEVAMSDFDLNGIYTARLETNFWDTGCYTLEVELLDMFGERKVERVPFCLI